MKIRVELCNPSDPYTIEINPERLNIAAIATLLLSQQGAYPLVGEEQGKRVTYVPAFMLGGFREWWASHSVYSLDGFEARHAVEIAEVLESVRLERAERSSMNDIGAAAKSIAKSLRDYAAQHPPASEPSLDEALAREHGGIA